MIDLLPLSVGIGLAVALLFTEVFGIAAGGMIVPGYLAIAMSKPLDVVVTVAAGFATFLIVHAVSSFTIIYGRRRTVMMILVGYLVGMFGRQMLGEVHVLNQSGMEIIGYIIPGLIAIWLDRQGVVETLAALVTASSVVRLVLVIVVGPELRVS